MNKTFEKILERLEERRKFHKRLISYEQNCGTVTEEYRQRKAVEVLDYVKEIVQEVAEEYNDGWIPCSGCKDCKSKECEHYGKIY